MSVGIVMLVHTALGRAEQVARHWTRAGCPVVIHVDSMVPRRVYDGFVRSLADEPNVGSPSVIAANGAPGGWWRRARMPRS